MRINFSTRSRDCVTVFLIFRTYHAITQLGLYPDTYLYRRFFKINVRFIRNTESASTYLIEEHCVDNESTLISDRTAWNTKARETATQNLRPLEFDGVFQR